MSPSDIKSRVDEHVAYAIQEWGVPPHLYNKNRPPATNTSKLNGLLGEHIPGPGCEPDFFPRPIDYFSVLPPPSEDEPKTILIPPSPFSSLMTFARRSIGIGMQSKLKLHGKLVELPDEEDSKPVFYEVPTVNNVLTLKEIRGLLTLCRFDVTSISCRKLEASERERYGILDRINQNLYIYSPGPVDRVDLIDDSFLDTCKFVLVKNLDYLKTFKSVSLIYQWSDLEDDLAIIKYSPTAS